MKGSAAGARRGNLVVVLLWCNIMVLCRDPLVQGEDLGISIDDVLFECTS